MIMFGSSYSAVCLFLLTECLVSVQIKAGQDGKPVLQLVAMASEESSGTRTTQNWERGLEILPGARVAVQEVNSNPDILPGYQLELVEIITEGCSSNLALVQLIQHLTTNTEEEGEERQTVGIIGPLCSEAAKLVAMVSAHAGINLVQIVATQYYVFDGRDEHLNPFQMLPLGQTYANVVFELMRELDLENLVIMCSLEEDIYGCGNTNEILNINDNIAINLSFTFASPKNIRSTLLSVRESGAKFILAVLPDSLAAEVVCTAYLEGMIWPEYGWIFPDLNFSKFTARSACGNDTDAVRVAIEGLFFLDTTKLQFLGPSTQLVSGHNYSTYYSSYIQELRETANKTQKDLHSNFFASVFYDSAWAFALALNKSLSQLYFENTYFGNNAVAASITSALVNLSEFSGATGPVAFDENHNRDNVVIQINQIKNGQSVNVGQYNPSPGTVTINPGLLGAFPDDDFEVAYDVLPLPLAILLSTLSGLDMIFLTVLFALHVFYRNEPEVKATQLSQFMFLGCYLLLLGTLSLTISSSVEVHGTPRIASCQFFLCLTLLGIIAFLSTLLVRLVRVYRVFSYLGRTGKECSNGVLSAVILSLMLVMVLFLALWGAVDTYQYVDERFFRQCDGEPPYWEVHQFCESEYYEVWISVTAAYIVLLLLGVAVLAVKTRKIRRENFKDTKKLNFLVVILVMMWTLFPSFLVITNDPELRVALSPVPWLVTAFSYQCLFFLPKVYPPLSRALNGTFKVKSKQFIST